MISKLSYGILGMLGIYGIPMIQKFQLICFGIFGIHLWNSTDFKDFFWNALNPWNLVRQGLRNFDALCLGFFRIYGNLIIFWNSMDSIDFIFFWNHWNHLTSCNSTDSITSIDFLRKSWNP